MVAFGMNKIYPEYKFLNAAQEVFVPSFQDITLYRLISKYVYILKTIRNTNTYVNNGVLEIKTKQCVRYHYYEALLKLI